MKPLGHPQDPGSSGRVPRSSSERMPRDVNSPGKQEKDGTGAIKSMASSELKFPPWLCNLRKAT